MKMTPWFPNSIRPVRVGVYEIRGSRNVGRSFRRWDGFGWSGTYAAPDDDCQNDDGMTTYKHGYDMTGWRGIEK